MVIQLHACSFGLPRRKQSATSPQRQVTLPSTVQYNIILTVALTVQFPSSMTSSFFLDAGEVILVVISRNDPERFVSVLCSVRGQSLQDEGIQ